MSRAQYFHPQGYRVSRRLTARYSPNFKGQHTLEFSRGYLQFALFGSHKEHKMPTGLQANPWLPDESMLTKMCVLCINEKTDLSQDHPFWPVMKCAIFCCTCLVPILVNRVEGLNMINVRSSWRVSASLQKRLSQWLESFLWDSPKLSWCPAWGWIILLPINHPLTPEIQPHMSLGVYWILRQSQ